MCCALSLPPRRPCVSYRSQFPRPITQTISSPSRVSLLLPLPTPPPRQPGRRRAHNYGFATARFLACLPSFFPHFVFLSSLPRGMRAYNRTSPAPLVAYGRVKTFVNPMSLILCLNRSITPKMPFQFTLSIRLTRGCLDIKHRSVGCKPGILLSPHRSDGVEHVHFVGGRGFVS